MALPSDTIYVRSRDSYPLGRLRTPLARPDLIHMLYLDGRLFSLKVVVLLRNLSDCIRSAHRMGWDMGDADLQVCAPLGAWHIPPVVFSGSVFTLCLLTLGDFTGSDRGG